LLVSRLAKQHVTVALTGDGGDELFGGYSRYLAARSIWLHARRFPRSLRWAAGLLGRCPPSWWDALNTALGGVMPGRMRVRDLGSKMFKLGSALGAYDDVDFYRRAVSRWNNPSQAICSAHAPQTLLEQPEMQPRSKDFLDWMMAMDASTYLHDDVLAKVDRASMAYSLETRVPLLDHRVVEFALRLSSDLKLREGVGKWPLRQVLYRSVPRELIERPKAGFGVPMAQWLRGPLRPWAESLLNETLIRQQGYFRSGVIARLWRAHQTGRVDASSRLWSVLMFQAWLAELQ
ncbi:MAG: asparagine synthetase B family protein, partial [Oceanococcaceae bacterium]